MTSCASTTTGPRRACAIPVPDLSGPTRCWRSPATRARPALASCSSSTTAPGGSIRTTRSFAATTPSSPGGGATRLSPNGTHRRSCCSSARTSSSAHSSSPPPIGSSPDIAGTQASIPRTTSTSGVNGRSSAWSMTRTLACWKRGDYPPSHQDIKREPVACDACGSLLRRPRTLRRQCLVRLAKRRRVAPQRKAAETPAWASGPPPASRKEYFDRKVMTNRVRSGRHGTVADDATAQAQWPRLTACRAWAKAPPDEWSRCLATQAPNREKAPPAPRTTQTPAHYTEQRRSGPRRVWTPAQIHLFREPGRDPSSLRFDLTASHTIASTTVRESVGLVRERSSCWRDSRRCRDSWCDARSHVVSELPIGRID
jgi:hypothetical protein